MDLVDKVDKLSDDNEQLVNNFENVLRREVTVLHATFQELFVCT